MIIMMAVEGENIWTEEEGRDATPEDLFNILKDNEVDDDTAYKAIGHALVAGNAEITTDGGVITISIN